MSRTTAVASAARPIRRSRAARSSVSSSSPRSRGRLDDPWLDTPVAGLMWAARTEHPVVARTTKHFGRERGDEPRRSISATPAGAELGPRKRRHRGLNPAAPRPHRPRDHCGHAGCWSGRVPRHIARSRRPRPRQTGRSSRRSSPRAQVRRASAWSERDIDARIARRRDAMPSTPGIASRLRSGAAAMDAVPIAYGRACGWASVSRAALAITASTPLAPWNRSLGSRSGRIRPDRAASEATRASERRVAREASRPNAAARPAATIRPSRSRWRTRQRRTPARRSPRTTPPPSSRQRRLSWPDYAAPIF